ncbi:MULTISPECIES: homocysteine S-methyltransferase family protein [unclassified Methylophaga]|jgi:S-methylmethionine-dependent homocysteine/selenocysteine methylase|uniref:homocysteine S-methyltransferase family protein n=1 Tax=unclassified Methylophaga TaxID=2629249 RepID=UPI0025F39E5E|nr:MULTISPECIES: homocysteine S-methyltransferase family protein [unclassified Methylophaga]|tara:strand:- start:445 stop:1392 length:948 start_codon:yes stop_codon:yes gene_type:complete
MKYRHALPQLADQIFLTDGGMETTLVFIQGVELPYFAAFDQLCIEPGRQRLQDYYVDYISLAKLAQRGFILESPTWRANRDWGIKLGYSGNELAEKNGEAIAMLASLRNRHETLETPLVISGCIGPRGDGYVADNKMSAQQAHEYHREQVRTFAETEADMVTAMTINYVEEAIGIVNAAQEANMPVVISFTTETDGCLPTGESLAGAITRVDAETNTGPAYYMINCAHPEHFRDQLKESEPWMNRIRGVRANASRKSHAELDESESLDRGDPTELGQQYRELRDIFPNITVLGGCCGTDLEHVEAIHEHCCRPLR